LARISWRRFGRPNSLATPHQSGRGRQSAGNRSRDHQSGQRCGDQHELSDGAGGGPKILGVVRLRDKADASKAATLNKTALHPSYYERLVANKTHDNLAEWTAYLIILEARQSVLRVRIHPAPPISRRSSISFAHSLAFWVRWDAETCAQLLVILADRPDLR
jgi:hypothetical protein